jgi:uncharacterized protein (UPF0332 family)
MRERFYMDKEYYMALANVRIARARELLEDAKSLLSENSYKSANNRAFYAMEKPESFIGDGED